MMKILKLNSLILMTSFFAYAKGPMLHGTYYEATHNNSIGFVTVDIHGTATRVSSCNVHPLCAQSRVEIAHCTNSLERECSYLKDIVMSKLRFDSQSTDYPWIVEYSFFEETQEKWTPLFTVRSSTIGEKQILVQFSSESIERVFNKSLITER